MPDFKKRDTTPELMDTEIVSYEELRGVLRELTQANELSLAYRPTLSFFKRLAREGRLTEDRRIVVIDAASGYGDMSRKVDAWAAKNAVNIEIIGVDMNPWAARVQRQKRQRPADPLRWVTGGSLRLPSRGRRRHYYEFFVHASFARSATRSLHSLDGGELPHRLVHQRYRTPPPLPYHFLIVFWATRRHRFMRHDGPVSIASAFKKRTGFVC